MSTTLIVVGLGLAGAAYLGRLALQTGKIVSQNAHKMPKPIISRLYVSFGTGVWATFILHKSFSSYYKGGFEPKISKREAALILGISPSSTKTKLREAHRRIMVLNHPDRGGSPYIASKINEAKDYMENQSKKGM